MGDLPGAYNLPDAERARMLARLALAWDGQWFLKVYEEAGWETAARLNAQVRQAFGRIEMLMLLRALGKRQADDPADAALLLAAYFDQVLAAGFRGQFRAEGDSVHVTVTECAALDGSRRAGLERTDQACVACAGLLRVYFETLLRGCTAEVHTVAQMGSGAECCQYVVQLGAGRGAWAGEQE